MRHVSSIAVCVRRLGALLGIAAVVLGLSGCAGLFGPRSVEVPRERLERLITERFPYQTRVLEVLDVVVNAPRLRLLPETNRLATDLELTVSERVFGNSHRGAVSLNSGLRFEPSDNTVRLTSVQVERVQIDGLPAPLQRQLDRVGTLIAEKSLSDRIVYTMRPQDVDAMRARGQHPGELRVTAQGLLISFVPD